MITPDRYGEFFDALHGYEPFPWQKRLAEQVAYGDWPDLLDLPTASGKTSVLDAAVFALACQAERPAADRSAPRRIAFVVDRRVIVDEAFERAKKIRDKLAGAPDGILREVADALRSLAGNKTPLQCFQLRGGMYRDDEWARTPTQPTILTSTVDQIGSRLLFRSYGFARNYTFPIHAGLSAYDMLIVLDEAHCAQPFEQTVSAAQRYRQWAKVTLPGPFRFVTMTATPPQGKTPFGLKEDDRVHPVLNRRLNAAKPTALIVTEGDLVDALVEQAEKLAQEGLRAIGIMVNRVATARAVFAVLQSRHGDNVLLLIGRMRPFDRDRVQNSDLFKQMLADNSGTRQLEQPVFVVATQTLEVGANLDFDGLVSECASLDALRQRFGRLNRMGRKIPAEGVIVIHADQAMDSADDPVYGAALAATWKWLNELSANGKVKGKRSKRSAEVATPVVRRVDMGINALTPAIRKLMEDERRRAALSQNTADAPVMLPAHVDAWAQTAPAPVPEPDVAIFLHGPQRGTADVNLVWRADVAEAAPEEVWIQAIALCPPTSVETLSAPLYLVRRWLSQQKMQADDLADVEGVQPDDERYDESRTIGRPVLLWHGPEDSQLTTNPNDILPGDTVVIPVSYSGWEVFGHLLHDALDVAEPARLQAKREAILRLHPALLSHWPDSTAKARLLEVALMEEEPEIPDLHELFSDLSQSGPDLLKPLFVTLNGARILKIEAHPDSGWVVTGTLPREKQPVDDTVPPFTDEDNSASLTNGRVALSDHCDGVTRFAVDFAKRCGLSPEVVQDFELAGRLHDVGKSDPRFQNWLYACSGQRFAQPNRPLLAKSIPASEALKWQAQAQSGYPQGARHELLSVSLIQHNESLRSQAHDWDLVLHLIASHHGRCRPFAPVVEDPNPVAVSVHVHGHWLSGSSRTCLERLDSGVAERFWALTRKYGWWGLAYLEAIFRLADHRQSELDTGR